MSSADITEATSVGGLSTLDRHYDQRSPMSAGHLNASTVSMRAKAQRKKKANEQHNSNFRAGYVPVDEEVLNRTGIRGRKRYFLYCFLIFLLVVALLNAAVTAWLLYIIGITINGMSSVEFTSMEGRDFMRVLADAYITSLSFKGDGFLGARYYSNLTIAAVDSKVEVGTLDFDNSSMTGLRVEGSNVTITADKFTIDTARQGSEPLTLDLQTFAEHGRVLNLHADTVTASVIKSWEHHEGLVLESTVERVEVSGPRGVKVTSGKDVDMKAAQISIDSKDYIHLESDSGIYMDSLSPPNSNRIDPNLLSYKLCVCRSGLLFAVPVTGPGVSCDLGAGLAAMCG